MRSSLPARRGALVTVRADISPPEYSALRRVGGEEPIDRQVFLVEGSDNQMAGIMRIRRSHGIAGGVLVALLGIWGGIIPFVGPYFKYAYTPATTWTYTTGRLWLEILPGAAALLGGLIMIAAGSRHAAVFGAFLGIVSGAWFALGNVFAPLWTIANPAGVPASSTTGMRVLEQIGFFTGLGIVLILVAAAVAGRVSAVPGVAAIVPRPRPAAAVEGDTRPVRRGWLWPRRRPVTVPAEEAGTTEAVG